MIPPSNTNEVLDRFPNCTEAERALIEKVCDMCGVQNLSERAKGLAKTKITAALDRLERDAAENDVEFKNLADMRSALEEYLKPKEE